MTWDIISLLRRAFTNRTYADKIIETQKAKKEKENLMLKIKSKFAASQLKSPLQPLIYNVQTHSKNRATFAVKFLKYV